MIIFIVLALAILLLSFVPNWWVKRILKKYDKPHPTLPGSAREYIDHLCRKFNIPEVTVVAEKDNNFYNPTTKAIHLDSNYIDSNSLTAITIAAHEFGHAIQDKNQEKAFVNRIKKIERANKVQRLSSMVLLAAPVLTLLSKSPILGFLLMASGVVPMLYAVGVHWQTLPVEYDASFNKALVILKETNALGTEDLTNARSILKAATMTYVAASLASVLDIWRWLQILRR